MEASLIQVLITLMHIKGSAFLSNVVVLTYQPLFDLIPGGVSFE